MLTQGCQMVIILPSFNTANKFFRNYLDMHTHKRTYTHTNKSIPIISSMPLFFFSYHLSFLIIINMPLILIFFISHITAVSSFQFLTFFFFGNGSFFFPQMKSYVNIQNKKNFQSAMEMEQKTKFSIIKPLYLVTTAQH